jgi:hypothetical protein
MAAHGDTRGAYVARKEPGARVIATNGDSFRFGPDRARGSRGEPAEGKYIDAFGVWICPRCAFVAMFSVVAPSFCAFAPESTRTAIVIEGV